MARQIIMVMILLISGAIHAQDSINIGITIRTVHRSRLSKATGEKYNNWNPGITIGYQTANNWTIETGFILNSYKKATWVTAFGYRKGDWELQLGGATGYKSIGQPWLRPGYFINYYAEPIKIKFNHEIINFGITRNISINKDGMVFGDKLSLLPELNTKRGRESAVLTAKYKF